MDNALAGLNHQKYLLDIEVYKPVTGVVDLSYTAKEYVRSVVGTNSPVFKRISKIKFTKKKVRKKRRRKK